MKGYKALYWDLSARPSLKGEGERERFGCFKYRIGGTYSMDADPVFCETGFHFCRSVSGTYVWYPNHFDTRICEVAPRYDAIVLEETYKCVTNGIVIVRELTPREITDKWIEEDARCRLKASLDVYFSVYMDCLRISIDSFRKSPETYVLWNGVTGRPRCPRPRDMPKLEKRADEWLAVLGTLEKEEK